MHETVIFLETSLTTEEARHLYPAATYLPSVKKGDVLKAIKNGYKRIVIIDGNFSWVPAVWHKEILTALDYGIEVWGAASMGALRAAELHEFGMKGHGRIYAMYKNEEVEGDDEVALVYSKYNDEQTIPLINIRLTLEKIDIPDREKVLNTIRSIFYAERTWSRMAQSVSVALYDLIRAQYVDAKREDAESLLSFLNQRHIPPEIINSVNKKRAFTLFEKKLIEETFSPAWLNQNVGRLSGSVDLQRAENILKLLSVCETNNSKQYYQSLLSTLDHQAYDITEYELIFQIERFREERGLLTGEGFWGWLKERGLHESNMQQLFSDYVKLTKYLVLNYDYNEYLN